MTLLGIHFLHAWEDYISSDGLPSNYRLCKECKLVQKGIHTYQGIVYENWNYQECLSDEFKNKYKLKRK